MEVLLFALFFISALIFFIKRIINT